MKRIYFSLLAFALFFGAGLDALHATEWRNGYQTNNGCQGAVAATDNGPISSDGNATCTHMELSNLPTYVFEAYGLTGFAAAPATDFFCIAGSASHVVRIAIIDLLMQSTSATPETVYFVKRSTLDTGGTPTVQTLSPVDSADPAATATLTTFGAEPATLGTAVFNFYQSIVTTGTLTAAPGVVSALAYYGAGSPVSLFQAVTLRNATEALCANFNGATTPAGFVFGVALQETEF